MLADERREVFPCAGIYWQPVEANRESFLSGPWDHYLTGTTSTKFSFDFQLPNDSRPVVASKQASEMSSTEDYEYEEDSQELSQDLSQDLFASQPMPTQDSPVSSWVEGSQAQASGGEEEPEPPAKSKPKSKSKKGKTSASDSPGRKGRKSKSGDTWSFTAVFEEEARIQFMDRYRDLPVLYDKSSKEYRNAAAWAEAYVHLGEPWGLSTSRVKKVIKCCGACMAMPNRG